MISRIKGTHDLLDLSLYNFIIDAARNYLALYAFSEIATPIIEPLELFKRTLGAATDVVSKEMFVIEPHTETHEASICLRPEGTAAIMRAFLENGVDVTPWRVFCCGPMFRYERPQKGRSRQFHQVTIEVIGSQAVSQNVELILLLDRYFRTVLKIENFALIINSLGCSDDREKHRTTLRAFLDKADVKEQICGFCSERMHKNILRIFDCKNEACHRVYQAAPMITHHLCSGCTEEWTMVQEQLHLLSVSYIHKPTLVRGLDYYNKTVFEFVSDDLGAQNAFCGGGRYDSLARMIGSEQDYPSIGAAFGIDRLMLLLEKNKDLIVQQKNNNKVMIMPLDKQLYTLALLVADELRALGKWSVDLCLEGASIKSMMRRANKQDVRYALIIGEDERVSRTVVIKDMVTGNQERVAQKDIASYLV